MTATFLIAVLLIPFSAELLARRPDGSTAKHPAFFLLVPLMGLLVYGGFLIIAAHPMLALGGSALYYFGLTAISNKKMDVLKSPFNAHDFDNARNLYIYPEFYLSYVGWPLLVMILAVFAGIVGLSLYFEEPIAVYALGPWYIVWPLTLLWWFGSLWVLARILTVFIKEENAPRLGISFELSRDIARFGLFPTVFLYRLLLKEWIDKKALRQRSIQITVPTHKPDIIAIQGESYFDLERLFTRIDGADKWQSLRALEAEGVQTGLLEVPAWGAYTMQTEFSFLSGIPNKLLGIDRINPYMRFAQRSVNTYAAALKAAGYRTICVHPAKKEFFRRSDVMPNLGFDEFIGLEAFEDAAYFGKYISDKALADKIDALVADHQQNSEQPLFIFAITIESHGPWAKGRLENHLPAGTLEELLLAENVTSDHEFTLYQEHMENLLALYRRLSVDAAPNGRSRVVAMYGDHMPALGPLFDKHGFADISTNYLMWSSDWGSAWSQSMPESIKVEELGKTVLETAGFQLR